MTSTTEGMSDCSASSVSSSNVISWYDGIFNEISKKKTLANAAEVKEEIVRNRTILNFNQDNFNLEKVVNTLNALKAGGIAVAGIVIDGVDFSKVEESDLQSVASYAKATKSKVWISATAEGDTLAEQAPAVLLPYFTAVVHLVSQGTATQLSILKMGADQNVDSTLKLDSKTLLITNK